MLGWAPACPCWVEGPEGSSWQGGQHGFETRTGAALATPRGHVLSPSTEEPAALSRSAGGGDVASPLAAMRFCPALEAPSQAGLGAGAGGLCPWRWEGSAGGGTVSSRRETGPGRPGRQPPRRCYSPGRRDGAGRDAWSLRATPARSPQTDWSAVPPPCRCSASQSRVLGTSWQLVGDGLAALRTGKYRWQEDKAAVKLVSYPGDSDQVLVVKVGKRTQIRERDTDETPRSQV